MSFATKDEARAHVWTQLDEEGVARFPFPVEGRIPNFEGAETAAERLLDAPLFDGATRVKVNPDSPQKHVRRKLLKRHTTVYVPTPRLEGGFMRFDPEAIPADHYADASMLSRWEPWAEHVELEALPEMDAIVTGSVAVTREGRRCGKGEGFSDLEFAIFRELGHPPVPVATTVHSFQIVDDVPLDDHDVGLSLIATPEELFSIADPPGPPDGIDWNALDEDDLEAMPVLKQLRSLD